MARGLGDGLLRFCKGAWRDDDGDAVDIVEVVRCKDCKHREDGMCALEEEYEYPWHYTKDDDFCSYGERK